MATAEEVTAEANHMIVHCQLLQQMAVETPDEAELGARIEPVLDQLVEIANSLRYVAPAPG